MVNVGPGVRRERVGVVARQEGVTLAHSLSLQPGAVAVRDGDFTFDTPLVRAIVLIFADDVPTRLRARRAEAYARFGPGG